MKKHSKALGFFAVSKQIPIVYSADRGRAENMYIVDDQHFDTGLPSIYGLLTVYLDLCHGLEVKTVNIL